MQRLIILVIFSSIVTLSGCIFPGVYKKELQQGQVMTDEMINQLQPGLTREQVAFVMGNPLTPSSLNQNRWDYIYWSKSPRDEVTQQRVSLRFENNRLAEITRTP